LLGRVFRDEDDVVNGPHVILLSYGFWQSNFGGDPQIVGRTVRVNSQDFTIVGVLPRTFELLLPPDAFQLRRADIWAPAQFNYDAFSRDQQFLTVIGRMKPGVTPAQAQSELNGISQQMQQEYTLHQVDHARIELTSLQEGVVEGVRPALLTLSVVVGFVLLIVCGNVANLMLARATVREKEIAVRISLGATKRQIFRKGLIESLLMSLGGAALGVLLASWGIDLLVKLRPANIPRLNDIRLDGWVLLFSLGACAMTTILLSIVSAIQISEGRLIEILKEGGRNPIGAGRAGLRRVLVVGEIALSLILLIAAGLFLRGFQALQNHNPGFRADGVQTFQISLPPSRYPRIEASNFYHKLNESFGRLAGIDAIGSTNQLPLTGTSSTTNYAWNAETEQTFASSGADWHPLSPGYFNALGIRFRAGRDFAPTDDLNHPRVAIVDSLIAKEAWGTADPIGKRLQILTLDNGFQRVYATVIGVVDAIRSDDIARAVRGQIYVSVYQEPFGRASFAFRTHGDAGSIIKTVEAEVAKIDPEVPVFSPRPLQDYVDEAMAPSKFSLLLVGIFGILALILASIGLYGVVTYSVSQRQQEIGVRMALGAEPRSIFSLVVGQGMAVVGVGIGIGLVGALALTRFINNMLYGVSAMDPLTFFGISVALCLVAFFACVIPAVRAMRLDPMVAMRYE
jgi:putative ABC transport system permease protein